MQRTDDPSGFHVLPLFQEGDKNPAIDPAIPEQSEDDVQSTIAELEDKQQEKGKKKAASASSSAALEKSVVQHPALKGGGRKL